MPTNKCESIAIFEDAFAAKPEDRFFAMLVPHRSARGAQRWAREVGGNLATLISLIPLDLTVPEVQVLAALLRVEEEWRATTLDDPPQEFFDLISKIFVAGHAAASKHP